MALDNIRKANKKSRRQSKRKSVQTTVAKQRNVMKIKQRRARKMIAAGRKEFHAKRRAEKDYLKQLEAEIDE